MGAARRDSPFFVPFSCEIYHESSHLFLTKFRPVCLEFHNIGYSDMWKCE